MVKRASPNARSMATGSRIATRAYKDAASSLAGRGGDGGNRRRRDGRSRDRRRRGGIVRLAVRIELGIEVLSQGLTDGLGGAVAIVASILGMAINMPAGRRLAEIGGRIQAAGRPPTPDEQATLAALQARLGRASVVAAVLLVIATTLMAIARYVP